LHGHTQYNHPALTLVPRRTAQKTSISTGWKPALVLVFQSVLGDRDQRSQF
jgi:hypothetical protein